MVLRQSQIVISPCNAICVLSLQPQHPCGPQPSPVATITLLCVLILPQWPQKSLLCGSQPSHVATTASCWSSAYPCSYHNFLLVLSGSVKPKSPLLWSSQSTPVTNKEARWSSDYSCIIIALCVFFVYHSFHKKPHLWCSANPLATTSSLVVLSLPL